MNLRTINLSDQWPFGLLTIWTYGTIFRPMTLRDTDLSDYWPFGPVHDSRTNEPSDQWPFGISSCPLQGNGLVWQLWFDPSLSVSQPYSVMQRHILQPTDTTNLTDFGFWERHYVIRVRVMVVNNFRITGTLWGKTTCHRWMPLTKGQWYRALIFSLLLGWTNWWVDAPVMINVFNRHSRDALSITKDNANIFRGPRFSYPICMIVLSHCSSCGEIFYGRVYHCIYLHP